MAQVTVTIAGRVYRMACGDGEEAHLESLAGKLDGKIAEMRAAFGEIGDQRLIVMAAIAFADSESEADERLASLEAELENARGEGARERERRMAWADALAAEIDRVCERVEKLGVDLASAAD